MRGVNYKLRNPRCTSQMSSWKPDVQSNLIMNLLRFICKSSTSKRKQCLVKTDTFIKLFIYVFYFTPVGLLLCFMEEENYPIFLTNTHIIWRKMEKHRENYCWSSSSLHVVYAGTESTAIFIIFWEFLMFYQVFLSP